MVSITEVCRLADAQLLVFGAGGGLTKQVRGCHDAEVVKPMRRSFLTMPAKVIGRKLNRMLEEMFEG
ncbi:hypothetical protein KCP76_16870 [Salmonella enterica subsp. enterica serovar Weltevreden]|nr:hypothetical protein KCP76_16870 [Salmonella enterica subsp. enterica serovar Weltevreden]